MQILFGRQALQPVLNKDPSHHSIDPRHNIRCTKETGKDHPDNIRACNKEGSSFHRTGLFHKISYQRADQK